MGMVATMTAARNWPRTEAPSSLATSEAAMSADDTGPHEDEAAHITEGVPDRGKAEDRRSPGGRVGTPRELGWAAVFLCSPWASYVTGHTMVVDGANWQRRHLLMPEFTPVREQLGKEPFTLEPPT